jgi:hypothetical protein
MRKPYKTAYNSKNNSRQSPCIVNPPDLIDLEDCGYGAVDRHRCMVAYYRGLVAGCCSVVCIIKHANIGIIYLSAAPLADRLLFYFCR